MGNGEASAVADVDNDGDIDIWHSDGGDGSLFLNDGSGVFVEASASRGLAIDMGSAQPYYGVSFGDYDNDGDLDAFFGHPVTKANRLYTNDGSGGFTLASALAVDLGESRGTAWGDFDNDGDLDLYVANDGARNYLYRNDGSGVFTDVAVALGVADGATSPTETVVFADYDNDGDLDLLTVGATTNRLYRNSLDDTDYLKVRVVGRGALGYSSRDGIGTRVELWNAAATTLLAVREVGGGGDWGAQSPQIVHFGLADPWGGGSGTYTVRARFLGGSTVTVSSVVPSASSIVIGSTTVPGTIEIME